MVINVYNPSDENLITPLMEYLQQNIHPSQYNAIIVEKRKERLDTHVHEVGKIFYRYQKLVM